MNGPFLQYSLSGILGLRRNAVFAATAGIAIPAYAATPISMTDGITPPVAALITMLVASIAALLLILFLKQRTIKRLSKSLIRNNPGPTDAATELHQFKAIVNQAAEAILITDTANVILYINPAFTRLLGYSLQDVIGQTPRLFRTDRHDEATYKKIKEDLHNGKIWKGFFTNRCKDGSTLELESIISPVFDDQGHITNFVSAAQDITHEVQLETQLRHAQKMEALGTLAGGISHDFNNILSAIIGYTELGLLDTPTNTSVHESLQQVMKAAKRAANLVSQILTFSRRNAQERQPILLAPIVKETIKLLRGTLPTTIEIRKVIADDLPPILADTTQIHQVLMNLCTNANHAMREHGGVLDVSLKPVKLNGFRPPWQTKLADGNYAQLTVSDTGHGMTPEICARIFEPYFTTKNGTDGTGLGLATVHGIVSAHEGAIHVDSTPNVGSTFTILLPACPAEAIIPGITGDSQKPKRGHNEMILVVDDEESIAKMIESILTYLGYKVEAYTSSVKAYEAFKDTPDRFDCVISDQTMPTLSGADLSRRLLAIRPNIPIVLCSGFSDSMNDEIAKEIGIRKFIMKPVTGKALAGIIQSTLNP